MAITKATKHNPRRELNSQHINHRETNFPAAERTTQKASSESSWPLLQPRMLVSRVLHINEFNLV